MSNPMLLVLYSIVIIAESCGGSAEPVEKNDPSGTSKLEAVSNKVNGLSLYVKAQFKDIDSAAIEFRSEDTNWQRTPFFPIIQELDSLPLAGLKPSRKYEIRIVGYFEGQQSITYDGLTFQTDSLPVDFPEFEFEALKKTEGYILAGMTNRSISKDPSGYALIIDMDGDVVWYRRFATHVFDFKKQPNGNYTVFANTTKQDHDTHGHYYEMDVMGKIVNEYKALYNRTDHHEFNMVHDGYMIPGVGVDTVTISVLGLTSEIVGNTKYAIQNDVIEYHKNNGEILSWNSIDFFDPKIKELPIGFEQMPMIRQQSMINRAKPLHLNSFCLDKEGNVIAGFRDTDNIIKIDMDKREIIWHLGGRNNQFTFINDSLHGFAMQHAPQILENGNLLLLDNGSLRKPPITRVLEYNLNETKMTAELVWEFRDPDGRVAGKRGNARRLKNGNTIICYGTTPLIMEVDMHNEILCQISSRSESYRAFKVYSLYK
jgi:hypothetical protein